ncbi:hypothetical protein BMS3Abin03_02081 [bacterium BMS3Abin03]|nr:hypothetical protein BMS3Abin03_02081 [bacterium BMS3Abin03]
MAIKRHKAFYILSHDHHHGLVLAQLIKKDAPVYEHLPKTIEEKVNYTIQSYRDKLIRHFNDEDEILFPKVKGKDSALDNRVDEIINEHREIESLVEELKTADKPETVLNKLGYLLESHIRKEERELFVKFQEVLTEEELSEIEIKLKSER